MGTDGTALEGGTAILMARIVDHQGQVIRPRDVSAIDYSIHELNRCGSACRVVHHSHESSRLEVGQVILDPIQTGSPWTVDEVGYNFRHAINFGMRAAVPAADVRYEVQYRLTTTTRQKTIVRFYLKAS